MTVPDYDISDVCDAIGLIAAEIPELRACYSAAAGSQGEDVNIVPRSVDDWPVGIVWWNGSTADAGNAEAERHDVLVRVWVNATDSAYALKTLYPFIKRFKAKFRANLDARGTCDVCRYVGADPIEVDQAHGKPFLVLPIRFTVLMLHYAHEYTLTGGTP